MARSLRRRKPTRAEKDHALKAERRLVARIEEAGEWATAYKKGRRYYQNQQWEFLTEARRRREFPVTANRIRRVVDRMTARTVSGRLSVEPRGRGADDFEIGEAFRLLHDWSRDTEPNWPIKLERAVDDKHQVGEGIVQEYWDQFADGGEGAARCRHIDPRYLVWDESDDPQREDADFVIYFPPTKVSKLEAEFPFLKGKVAADVPGLIEQSYETARTTEYDDDREPVSSREKDRSERAISDPDAEYAYRIEMWEKREVWETHYYMKNGDQVYVPDVRDDKDEWDPQGSIDALLAMEEGQEFGESEGRRPMRDAEFDLFEKEFQDVAETFIERRIRRHELWETVVVNKHLCKEELSEYDESKGGHGMYPFAFFCHVRIPERSRSMGEIEFLTGNQDLLNRTLSRWLQTLMVGNQGFFAYEYGSLDGPNASKFKNTSSTPVQGLEYQPGTQPPAWVGAAPTSANVFAAGAGMFREIMDEISGDRDVNRSGTPYTTSGRGILALQAVAELVNTISSNHDESALHKLVYMRMCNLQQFMRTERIARVMNSRTNKQETVLVGPDLEEMVNSYGLTTVMDADGRPEPNLYQRQDGSQVHLLILNDKTTRKFDIRLRLEPSRDLQKAAIMEEVAIVWQNLGPAAHEWALDRLDIEGRPKLLEKWDALNTEHQYAQDYTQILEVMQMSPEQFKDMIAKSVAGGGAVPATRPAPAGVTP